MGDLLVLCRVPYSYGVNIVGVGSRTCKNGGGLLHITFNTSIQFPCMQQKYGNIHYIIMLDLLFT